MTTHLFLIHTQWCVFTGNLCIAIDVYYQTLIRVYILLCDPEKKLTKYIRLNNSFSGVIEGKFRWGKKVTMTGLEPAAFWWSSNIFGCCLEAIGNRSQMRYHCATWSWYSLIQPVICHNFRTCSRVSGHHKISFTTETWTFRYSSDCPVRWSLFAMDCQQTVLLVEP